MPKLTIDEVKRLLLAHPKAELKLDAAGYSYAVFRSGKRWVFEPWDAYEDNPGTYSWAEVLELVSDRADKWRVTVTSAGRLVRKNERWCIKGRR